MAQPLGVTETPIPGLLIVDLPVHEDPRGWFKENWNREKMLALGLPDFGPVQNNVSFNTRRGVARGIHTEPWDKLVSVATGRVFAAWVDMREGESFGTVFTAEIGPDRAVFVPRGVGNSYQTLEDETSYVYLVNDHWQAGVYPALDLADPQLGISWPIPLAECELSEKDRVENPALAEISPIPHRTTLILGADGQLGRALRALLPDAVTFTQADGDLSSTEVLAGIDWRRHDVVINAAAYTAVDAAETAEGGPVCWAVNAHLPAALAVLAREHGFTLVHYSSDYVFDGVRSSHDEAETFAPLGVYGSAKAAGDLAVGSVPHHYLLRTSWVVGEGANFVATMAKLALDGVSPSVVDDQIGRLTFADELAKATLHLLQNRAAWGTYNVTNAGAPMSWAQIAAAIFAQLGREAADVAPISTEEYARGRASARRPAYSTLELAKLTDAGFVPEDQLVALERFVSDLRPAVTVGTGRSRS
ncbi:sugar nucleotide-binding protein [Nocardioides sp. Bht2]|uniref:sugar nucleotide-binding protein n=1 Tax=Nocardioides sp. Bht2 TaxID=3392297 RepID=UPI0039B6D5A0